MNKQQGFVLATTIWMVAILAVLAGLFHSYVEAQVGQALALQRRVQAELDLESTGAAVRYLMATRRTTLAGYTVKLEDQAGFMTEDGAELSPVGGELKLDGTVYRGLGDTYFRIQDKTGLLSVNATSTENVLQKILGGQLGSQRAKELAATLADYIDENTRRRFNGAESLQYVGSGLPGPTNWYLRTPAELHNVLGWRELLGSATGAQWLDAFTISYANVVNINTAPTAILQLMLGLDVEEARQLIEARNNYPFRSLDGVAEALGLINSWPEEEFRFYTGGRFRVSIWCDKCAYSVVQSFELTPDGFYGPWQMDYSYVSATLYRGSQDNEPATLVPGGIFSDSLPVGR